MLLQDLCSCRRQNERLSEELFGKTDDKENLEVLLNQLEQEKQRLMEKNENFEIKGKWSNVNYVPLNFEIENLAANNTERRVILLYQLKRRQKFMNCKLSEIFGHKSVFSFCF